MRDTVHREFVQLYATEPLLVRAPGRINLIGEHTDYNLGLVLPAATDKALYFALGRGADPQHVRLQALNYGETLRIDLSGGATSEIPSWGRYIRAMLEILREKGYPVQGFDGVFGGDIPIGAGMSSSAALCCGILYGLSELFQLDIPKTEIALIAQATEHRIGLNCGLMDQYAVLFGHPRQAICLDCRDLHFDYVPLELAGHSLVLINSKIEHQLAAGSGYNDRRAACEAVVHTLAQAGEAVQSLRDVPPALLEAHRSRLPELQYRRARFVLDENQRVLDARAALQGQDLITLGRLLYRAHAGMQTEYEISTPEIDRLVALAQQETAVLGARMMGGGFGGCTINLVEDAGADAALHRMLDGYRATTGLQAEVYWVRIGEGVQ